MVSIRNNPVIITHNKHVIYMFVHNCCTNLYAIYEDRAMSHTNGKTRFLSAFIEIRATTQYVVTVVASLFSVLR